VNKALHNVRGYQDYFIFGQAFLAQVRSGLDQFKQVAAFKAMS